MNQPLTCLFLSLLTLRFARGEPSEDYSHCTSLDGAGKYHACWTVKTVGEEDEIRFMVEVETHGYVGLGLSPNGAMAGSDIVTGWVRNGTAYFQDRHGIGNKLPVIDSHRDWFLDSGSENDTHTTLVFHRKLETCDEDDITVDDNTIRLIYAYSDQEPESEKEDIVNHKENRGAKSVLLLQQHTRSKSDIDKSQLLLQWEVLSPNFTITKEYSSRYWCKIVKSPEISEKHHIVLAEPVIEPGHEGYVHHMLLYECMGNDSNEYEAHSLLEGHECRHRNMPDVMKSCEGVYVVWAVGGEALVFPDDVGLPLEHSSSKYYMLEIHYDNSQRHDNITDRSGFRLYHSPFVRKYDAGSLMIGSTVSPRMFVPPAQKSYRVVGHSSPECLDPVMPPDGINLLGVMLHSHLLGRRLKLRHFRNNKELTPLGVDSTYDFNYQEYRYFSEPVKFMKGDQMTMECIFDSTDRNETTFGGQHTVEEMCLAFVLYYPRIERFASLSAPTLNSIKQATGLNMNITDPTWRDSVKRIVSLLGWSDEKIQEVDKFLNMNISNPEWYATLKKFLRSYDWNPSELNVTQDFLSYALQDVICYLGDGTKNSVKTMISYPEDLEAYEAVSKCQPKYSSPSRKSGCQTLHYNIFQLILTLFGILKVYRILNYN